MSEIKAKHCGNFTAESVSCPGRSDMPVFSESYDLDGVYQVIESGKFNIQDQINSFKDDVDIYKIIARSANDPSVLDRSKGQYLDLTSLPSNLHEAHKAMVDAQAFFNDLPLDIRQRYNHNFRQFVADFGSPEFIKIFTPKNQTQVSDVSSSTLNDSNKNTEEVSS